MNSLQKLWFCFHTLNLCIYYLRSFSQSSFAKNFHIHLLATILFSCRLFLSVPIVSCTLCALCNIVRYHYLIYNHLFVINFQLEFLKWSYIHDSPNGTLFPQLKGFRIYLRLPFFNYILANKLPFARGGADFSSPPGKTPPGRFRKGGPGGPGRTPTSSQGEHYKALVIPFILIVLTIIIKYSNLFSFTYSLFY